MTRHDPTAAELAALALGPYLKGLSRAEVDELLGDVTEIRVYATAPEPVLSDSCDLGFCRACRVTSCTCDCHASGPRDRGAGQTARSATTSTKDAT